MCYRDRYETEDGEEAEIIAVYDSSLEESKQNLVKRKFPYINTLYHEVPTVISTMRNINVGVFEHLSITSPMDVDKRLAYTQHILRGAALKKYHEVLVTCRQSEKELT